VMNSKPEGQCDQEARLTVGEAAQALGVSEKTVRDLIRRGELTAYRPTPRKTWVLRADLAAFWESRRVAPSEEVRKEVDLN
jgi:excisionase family DNA binding protein